MSTNGSKAASSTTPPEGDDPDEIPWEDFLATVPTNVAEGFRQGRKGEMLLTTEASKVSSSTTSTTTGSVLTELVTAADKADLIGVELKLVVAVAKNMGKAAIKDLEVALEKDVISALKRAKRKMKVVGWNLYRRNNHILAKPIPQNQK